jgi:hypothetical protein
VSPKGELGHPLPIPLTTLVGSDQNHSPSKTAFPKFSKTVFSLFTTSSSNVDFGKMEMNFKNPREVFVQNGLKKKTSSRFCTGDTNWENQICLSASFFQFLVFPVSVLILRELICRDGDEFGKTKGFFCPTHAHLQ